LSSSSSNNATRRATRFVRVPHGRNYGHPKRGISPIPISAIPTGLPNDASWITVEESE
jgi:hypothetical protein